MLAMAAVAPDHEEAVAAGTLIEFRKDKDRTGFALIQEPDGKRNWKAVDARWVVCLCPELCPPLDIQFQTHE